MLTRDIAKTLAGQLDGDGAIEIERLVHPAQATGPSDLALAISTEAAVLLNGSKAQSIVVSAANPVPSGSFRAIIAIDGGRLALAKLTALFDPGPAHEKGIHPTAIIAPDAKLGAGVNIGAYAVVGPRSHIGAGTTIMPHVTIGADVAIGAQGVFHSGVRVGDRTIIGERVIVHGNTVIGSDGFSYAPDLNSTTEFVPGVVVTRIHSLGIVEIADDVEIGACTTIDRATLESTRIGRGTKIDNHVHIGHNIVIGESCIVCGMVGISGSVIIGDRVRIGGGAGIADHIKIGDQAVIGGRSGVGNNVEPGSFVLGYPAIPHKRALEQYVLAGRQKKLHRRVEELTSRLDALEQSNKK
jgi:UDP-3-O-[3-hydroxymyristoyl] glucosamine N-acyltransferase